MSAIRRPLGGLLVLGMLAMGVLAVASTTDTSTTVASSSALPTAQPVIGLPVQSPTLIGSSPAEAPGETWGYSTRGEFQVVRYTPSSGWQIQTPPLEAPGQPLSGFVPAPGPLAGRTTVAGGVAIIGEDSSRTGQVLVRDPGGSFRETPTLTSETAERTEPTEHVQAAERTEPTEHVQAAEHTEPTEHVQVAEHTAETGKSTKEAVPPEPDALLKPGETLFASSGEGVLMAPVEEEDRRTGVFVVPFEASSHIQENVLHYDGVDWTREPICVGVGSAHEPETCTKPTSSFKVLAIDASSPQNAWLLATAGNEGIVLLSRDTSGPSPVWRQRSLGGSPFALAHPPFEKASVHVIALTHGQPLTVTSQGAWVDGELKLEVEGQPTTEDFTLFYEPVDAGSGRVAASWCDVPAALESLCSNHLEADLPSGDYRSFAWPGNGPYGQRVITGLEEGVSLSLQGTSFVRVLGVGGSGGTSDGAAFSSPQEGWLADASNAPLTHLTTEPVPDRMQSWPVPFRRPLTAIAEQPGATAGDPGAQAFAVGADGQVAHYIPGQGWTPEALLSSSSGLAQTPDLRGVAWPEAARAYAVGSAGAMWLWQSSTGLWEPDPARPPNLFLANFTGIAFDPSEPARGYAAGQQGLLLGYGKTWTQEALPPGLEGADFTSIAFAGNEALVTYQIPHFGTGAQYAGGLLVNEGAGSGWHVDSAAASVLGASAVPVRVAGLPDGGAVFATATGEVFEREGGPGSPWQPSPASATGYYPVALAAFRESGALRAVVSVDTKTDDLNEDFRGSDEALERPSTNQAPIATNAYPLPTSGFLLRETSSGWEDEEHQDYPTPNTGRRLPSGESGFDWPSQPDATLALAFDPDGSQGWAVGGQTGELNNKTFGSGKERSEAIQTAGVMRYPQDGPAPTGFASSPTQTGAGNATFVIGGDARCATACADLANDRLGPDEWLSNAISHARQTPGARAFLYTGSRLANGLGGADGIEADAFQREENRYAQLLTGAAGSFPVFAAPSESDIDHTGTLQSFSSAFQALSSPQGSATPSSGVRPIPPTAPNVAYFSFDSTGAAGTVRVIVLDYSSSMLGTAQQCWLAEQLSQAKAERAPAIVIGSRELSSNGESGNVAADAAQVIPTVVNGTPPAGCALSLPAGGASAYFYNYPQQNRTYSISAGGASIPTFGSGTLGYVSFPSQQQTQFLGAGGSLLAEVEVAKRNAATNRAPVSVRLIPDISDLALDATNGVLLRRSQAALFTALARHPHAGMECAFSGAACEFQPDPYVPVPSTCQGSACATGILPAYTFTSSNPDIGDFVEPDPASPEGTTVLQGANGKPIPDAHSGLFCAYNAGTTTVTVQTGGLSYSQPITILSGSVEQPCGTAPLRNPPAATQQAGLPVPLPAPAPALSPKGTLPPPPAAPTVVPIHHPAVAAKPHHAQQIFPRPAVQLFPLLALVPPPAPSVARPTPPSGTAQVPSQSPVSQQVEIGEQEREEQSATEGVHHMVAYRHPEETPIPTWSLGLVLIALAAGIGTRGRFRAPELAYSRVLARRHGSR